LLIAPKEEAGIQFQDEEFDLMDIAGDIDEIEEMDQLSVEHNGGTVEKHPATVEETRAYFESVYNNFAIEVEKVNSVNRKMKETNAEFTNELARYKNQEKRFEINQEEYDILERINPCMTSRVDNVMPNKPVKASIRTKPITTSQPHVISQENVNSNLNGISSTGVESTAKTRRPQPRSNPKNDRIPSASKSSCLSNNLEKVEEQHRNLWFSKTLNDRSSKGNNIKLAIQKEKSEVVYTTSKQCLITANHDECVFKYVNGMKSSKKNQSANVSKNANQKKHKPNVKKSKKLGSEERLASPRPSKPRT
ncbi:hypothetical protein Tco_0140286, partial [Tanacetum coccineum]